MLLDPALIARLQFAFTITFHIVFPAFTIGLSAYIATLLVIWRATGRDRYHRLARFWTRIFAVSFAMGVVSGIVLSYQFGTNWSRLRSCLSTSTPAARRKSRSNWATPVGCVGGSS
jgi:cytochrome d ubiquinol oxidase subunit I